MSAVNFFSSYFDYVGTTEVPTIFHRWAAIAGVGSFLGRSMYINHGHFSLIPNKYIMLIGSPGTRKSTAIKLIKHVLQAANYTTIAADKTTKEKFLLDLAGEDSTTDLSELHIFGEESQDPKEMLIAADEFNDFVGIGNIEFISLLGTLWDYNGVYRNRIKTGKSVAIRDPTVSILGGNTPTGFALAFPPEILGQGFFSRLLLIYGETTNRKIAFPKPPTKQATEEVISTLLEIRQKCTGELKLTHAPKLLLEKIYTTWDGLDDVRFESYSNRRFAHLLKLCIIVAAVNGATTLTEDHIIFANTILHHTEHLMPKALGEFGKAKHADVVHKVMTLLDTAGRIVSLQEIWQAVVQDLERITELSEILRNLSYAKKIQAVEGGFLPRRKLLVELSTDILDFSLLTPEELQA